MYCSVDQFFNFGVNEKIAYFTDTKSYRVFNE